jgi:hypothetical protein
MTDEELADELIVRLNGLIAAPVVNDALTRLIETRIDVGDTLDAHPTIQVSSSGLLGFQGMLNGIVGAMPGCCYRQRGFGFITVIMNDERTQIIRFERTK